MMTSKPNHGIILVILLIGLAGVLPLVAYWFAFGNVKTVSAQDAVTQLTTPASNAILVDVRSAEEYAASHIEGTENWSLASIQSIKTIENIPDQFKNKTLLLICDSGITSVSAVRALERIGFTNAYNVHGGMDAWTASAFNLGSSFSSLRFASGQLTPLTPRVSPIGEQLAVFLAGYAIKPIYMLLSLGLIVLLGRATSLDLVTMRWSMIFFFIGEMACWVNFLALNEQSDILEYIHSFGMVLSVGFLVFAMIEIMDDKVIHFSAPQSKCALLGLCRECAKYKTVACGLKRLFKIGIPALIVLALMPLNANIQPVSYNATVLGFFHNYGHSVFYQLYETRFSPLAAIGLLSISFALLFLWQGTDLLPSKIFLAAGVGFLSFGFLRLALFAFYRDNLVWFSFWEEATELVLVGGIVLVLWIFRKGLALPLVENFI